MRVPGSRSSQVSRQPAHEVAKLSALSTGRQEIMLIQISLRGLVDPGAKLRIKNSSDTIGNLSSPACGAVPQPTAPLIVNFG